MVTCAASDNLALFYAELVFKAILVVTACVLSFLTRNIPGVIAGTRALIVIVYNIAFWGIVTVLVIRQLSDVQVIVFIEVLGISVSVCTSASLLVIPIFYELVYFGDAAATEEVMQAVSNSKPIDHRFRSIVPDRAAAPEISTDSFVKA